MRRDARASPTSERIWRGGERASQRSPSASPRKARPRTLNRRCLALRSDRNSVRGRGDVRRLWLCPAEAGGRSDRAGRLRTVRRSGRTRVRRCRHHPRPRDHRCHPGAVASSFSRRQLLRGPRSCLRHAHRPEPARRAVAVDCLDPVAVGDSAPRRSVEEVVGGSGDGSLGDDQRVVEPLPGGSARAVDLEAEQVDLCSRPPVETDALRNVPRGE